MLRFGGVELIIFSLPVHALLTPSFGQRLQQLVYALATLSPAHLEEQHLDVA